MDLSLYNDESQLKGQKKRKANRRSKNEEDLESESSDDEEGKFQC